MYVIVNCYLERLLLRLRRRRSGDFDLNQKEKILTMISDQDSHRTLTFCYWCGDTVNNCVIDCGYETD